MQDNINNENSVDNKDNKDNRDYGDNLLFSIKNNELLIDGMNGEQLYKINNTLNKKYVSNNKKYVGNKNKLPTKKKSHKLNIKQIKKQRKEKKTKAVLLIK